MSNQPRLWNVLFFLKRNRARKKRQLRKMAFQLMVDKTTGFYLLVLGGYLFASIFIFGDMINKYEGMFLTFEKAAMERVGFLITALPMAYVFQSIKNPGIIFTSSELKLSYLTFSIKRIWLYCVLEKWVKSFFFYLLSGLLVVLVTPLSFEFVITYTGTLWLIGLLMTLPQWKLFQSKWYIKVGCLLVVALLNIVNVMTSADYIGIIALVLLVFINMLLIPSIFQFIHWGRVAELNDFKIWTMPLIERASNTRLKRQKRYSIFQNTKKRKKPFRYTEKAIYHRLWQVYFSKNLDLVSQVVGTLLLMLIIFVFINSFFVFLGIAVAVHVITSLAASFFVNRFKTDIIEVLPWELYSYKRTLIKWLHMGLVPIVLPVIPYFILNYSLWLPIQLVFIYSAFLLTYHIKVNKSISILRKENKKFQIEEVIGFIGVVLIVISESIPTVSLTVLLIVFLIRKYQKDVTYVTDEQIR
ncbi:hypothetical protein [Ornithinibacillus halophilus]|uniref:Uncharacterized protein n=1 Tax=Ornithinibacillus halophilus TaxID=930117 RepID=A0A1M5IW44_9BACI|nr:hypothetical protein [Ornithinibacillus halophilus]SHG32365.1 hypothetical protein SAMN05216225_102631 [Ornithinibacillus halophilus]